MATRLISKSVKVGDVLTNVTSAKLSDPTGTYGIKKTVAGTVVVADGTDMTNSSTGVYEYSFTDEEDIAYTAYMEIVYGGKTYHFEIDIPARAAVGAMVASYSSLLGRVGHFLYGLRSGFSTDQTTDIEDCIKDGLHDVYTAHTWSFFRPIKPITTTAPYATGTITVVDGVVTLSGGTFPSWAAVGILKIGSDYYDVNTRDGDTQITLDDTTVDEDAGTSYSLGRHEYDLPTGFEEIVGKQMAYEPGQSDYYPPINERHDDQLRVWQQDDPYFDRPLYFSTRTVEFDPTVGSRRRLVLYPTPDAAYVLKAPMQLRATMIDGTNQYPVGAEGLTPLILEACLAAAERNFDDRGAIHTQRFQELLPLAIAADQEKTSPTKLGPDSPKVETTDQRSLRALRGDVPLTLDGVSL